MFFGARFHDHTKDAIGQILPQPMPTLLFQASGGRALLFMAIGSFVEQASETAIVTHPHTSLSHDCG
jgi:hypothetical protein